MNNKAIAIVIALVSAFRVAAQEQPQIAYRILSGYVDKKQAEANQGKKTGGLIVAGTGGMLLAAGATTWFYGDDISNSASGSPMDIEAKVGMALGLGLGGLTLTLIGGGLLFAKPNDFRAQYAEVFDENDAQIQEALAIAALKDISIQGKKVRITGAVSSFLTPLIFGAILAAANVNKGEPWSDGITDSLYWNAFSIAGGISALFSTTEEERLYEKYRAGREAFYGDFQGSRN
ncbi:MAG: hypothetical protein A2Z99_06160 [Treponema sp. GWB1_62_6]|nr:MAG: hypothetical protein A2Y36_04695 [Treponema sp. GWA1_62_8]OHE64628.1 MAG: hypothetical protein A2Z99_06160 [Treponema sp. GWB1_62_6]OHE69455.1 MAG: hypothetical protein A2001_18895 [Treponema sp. GWC1_61_84]OHE71642.1 MAG: hypothetical protein A2413_01995 [Treponema sp. RIFOXYC1_FULL_61_9]HCM25153.1 hypothetical protein [Treponema sp.]